MAQTKTMTRPDRKTFKNPDETRVFPHGTMEILQTGGGVVGRMTAQPGWRWSKDVKPIANTTSCEESHFMYQIAGVMRVKMEDGTEFDIHPGDVVFLPAGHDAWVVGDEPVVAIDWNGATHYATPKR